MSAPDSLFFRTVQLSPTIFSVLAYANAEDIVADRYLRRGEWNASDGRMIITDFNKQETNRSISVHTISSALAVLMDCCQLAELFVENPKRGRPVLLDRVGESQYLPVSKGRHGDFTHGAKI